MRILKGWKTLTGAAVLLLTGAAKALSSISDFPNIDTAELQAGLALCGGALAAVGIGHKIEKGK